MIRILPFILIPVLLLGGLWYWRNVSSKPEAAIPVSEQNTTSDAVPAEVPKTLPGATEADRIKILEDAASKLSKEINNLKTSGGSTAVSSTLDSRLSAVESSLTDLKIRITALEKATPAPVASSTKYPLYIPLGAGGGPWTDQAWNSLNEYQTVINPDNYPGYSGMQLEVNFRLTESAGTGSVRLYNVTDSSSISSQVDTTSTAFSAKSSSTFKLPAGQKTYTIQVQSSQGKQLFVQFARIKVSF